MVTTSPDGLVISNADVKEGMLLLEQSLHEPVPRAYLNRFAAKRLFISRGKEKTLKALIYALSLRGTPFAPFINDFISLEVKWPNLEAYTYRQAQTPKGGVFDATGGEG